MIISSYYDQGNKNLILATTQNAKNKKIEKEDNIIKIYNEENNLIGVNILNYENKNLSFGLIDNEKIMDIIKKYFKEEIEFPFVVGEIVEMEDHPKSTKLHICQVELGKEKQQIVCGAQNVKIGIKVIVAKVGAVMPSGIMIKPSKLIDVKSNGMICSLNELGKSEETGVGIAILDNTYEVGEAFN